jgi:hypothetical protein
LELLSQIPLQLPGPPSHRLSYDKAFRKLIYPTLDHRILYGSVFLENLDGPVRLSSQETVAGTSHPCPSAADKPASIFLPALEACPSSDDVAFLRKREKLGPLSKYISTADRFDWPARCSTNASIGNWLNFVRSIRPPRPAGSWSQNSKGDRGRPQHETDSPVLARGCRSLLALSSITQISPLPAA